MTARRGRISASRQSEAGVARAVVRHLQHADRWEAIRQQDGRLGVGRKQERACPLTRQDDQGRVVRSVSPASRAAGRVRAAPPGPGGARAQRARAAPACLARVPRRSPRRRFSLCPGWAGVTSTATRSDRTIAAARPSWSRSSCERKSASSESTPRRRSCRSTRASGGPVSTERARSRRLDQRGVALSHIQERDAERACRRRRRSRGGPCECEQQSCERACEGRRGPPADEPGKRAAREPRRAMPDPAARRRARHRGGRSARCRHRAHAPASRRRPRRRARSARARMRPVRARAAARPPARRAGSPAGRRRATRARSAGTRPAPSRRCTPARSRAGRTAARARRSPPASRGWAARGREWPQPRRTRAESPARQPPTDRARARPLPRARADATGRAPSRPATRATPAPPWPRRARPTARRRRSPHSPRPPGSRSRAQATVARPRPSRARGWRRPAARRCPRRRPADGRARMCGTPRPCVRRGQLSRPARRPLRCGSIRRPLLPEAPRARHGGDGRAPLACRPACRSRPASVQ